jgi:hypothetical protein
VSHDHVFQIVEQRVAMVARDVADNREGQYRPALAGEPVVPVLWDDAECVEDGCSETTIGWRPVRLEDLNRVERAMQYGCDGLCGCRCHS